MPDYAAGRFYLHSSPSSAALRDSTFFPSFFRGKKQMFWTQIPALRSPGTDGEPARRCSEDLPGCRRQCVWDNGGMFIRPCYRIKDGKRHAYWALVESYRTARGPRQRTVAYLGQMDRPGRLGAKRTAQGRRSRQAGLFDDTEPDWVVVDTRGGRVERRVDFGGPWLALELIWYGVPGFGNLSLGNRLQEAAGSCNIPLPESGCPRREQSWPTRKSCASGGEACTSRRAFRTW